MDFQFDYMFSSQLRFVVKLVIRKVLFMSELTNGMAKNMLKGRTHEILASIAC